MPLLPTRSEVFASYSLWKAGAPRSGLLHLSVTVQRGSSERHLRSEDQSCRGAIVGMIPPAPYFSSNELNANNAMVRFGLESEEDAPAFRIRIYPGSGPGGGLREVWSTGFAEVKTVTTRESMSKPPARQQARAKPVKRSTRLPRLLRSSLRRLKISWTGRLSRRSPPTGSRRPVFGRP